MLWCLHGFLGRGSDWDALHAAWPGDLPPLRCPSLFGAMDRAETLEEFGARFAGSVAAADAAPLLLGYSLGGRLALHALLARPGLWRGAVLVSTHLGLADPGARHERRASDAAWSERFRETPWAALMDEWNAREVFRGRAQALARPEEAYDRNALGHALEAWSLGSQEYLVPRLAGLPMPILWIVGAEDDRYVAQGELAAAHGTHVELRGAPGAAHRVPWEAPDWFAREVAAFIRRLAPA
jgi:2-succinyl-6-hydroxy-2,4-cyclohexadiene-1-carboxylate synthase